jgi:hypothetical protein
MIDLISRSSGYGESVTWHDRLLELGLWEPHQNKLTTQVKKRTTSYFIHQKCHTFTCGESPFIATRPLFYRTILPLVHTTTIWLAGTFWTFSIGPQPPAQIKVDYLCRDFDFSWLLLNDDSGPFGSLAHRPGGRPAGCTTFWAKVRGCKTGLLL